MTAGEERRKVDDLAPSLSTTDFVEEVIMQKWEYMRIWTFIAVVGTSMTVRSVDDKLTNPKLIGGHEPLLTSWLEEAGNDGWEIAGTISNSSGNGVIFLKRPKP